MTPHDALNLLEAVRPDSADRLAPEAQEAFRALDDSPELLAVVERRILQDGEIGRAIRDVPVPAEAKRRLLERLAASVEGVPTTSASAATEAIDPACPASVPVSPVEMAVRPSPRSVRRRRVARVVAGAVAASVLLAVGLSLALRDRSVGPIALEQLRTASPAWDELVPFPAGSVPAFPASYAWLGGPIKLDQTPRIVPIEGSAGVQIAAYRFRIDSRGRTVVEGWLAAVPASQVSDPPEQAAFSTGDVRYHNGMATVSWREGETVFVCFVRGNDAAVRILERALGARAA